MSLENLETSTTNLQPLFYCFYYMDGIPLDWLMFWADFKIHTKILISKQQDYMWPRVQKPLDTVEMEEKIRKRDVEKK